MAVRSVFVSKASYPFFEEIYVEFDWFGGFALSQKRKCQIGLHRNFLESYREHKTLEVSSSSLYSLGTELSAMNLSKRTKEGLTSVESAFQSSRIYGTGDEAIGPFHDYLFLPGKECKKRVKELSKGLHSSRYLFDGMTFHAPAHHISQFYDYLFLNALLEPENQEVREKLLRAGYTAFTDLATKSLNCQARSCAIFVGLVQAGRIDEVKGYESYLKLFRTNEDGNAMGARSYEGVQLLKKDKVQLRSPVVPCTFRREKVEQYYREHCSLLTNKKEADNFLDKQTV